MSFRRNLQIFTRQVRENIQEINEKIEILHLILKEHPKIKKKLEAISRSVENVLVELGEIFNSCKSCLNCKDCCCFTPSPATYFYHTSLIYLASLQKKIFFSSAFIEEAKKKKKLVCAFYSSKGCVLPRNIRPFVCVTFLCNSLFRELDRKGVKDEVNDLIRKLNFLIYDLDSIYFKLKKIHRQKHFKECEECLRRFYFSNQYM